MKIHIGTTKGLITLRQEGQNWISDYVQFLGLPVSMIHHDAEKKRWWAALSIKHWGPKLHCSTDSAKTWQEVPTPRYPMDCEIKPGIPATLRLIWSIANDTKHLWIGTDPGGLFKANRDGSDAKLVASLWNHESRKDHWFGGGRNYPGIHTICVDPRNEKIIYIGVSCAGVFKSTDGGETWAPSNSGLRADYLPNPNVSVGHDPHSMQICHAEPDVIWQQNHCGVFRSSNGGKLWQDVTSSDGLGGYGFGLVIDHEDPLRAWIIPAQSDECRVAHKLALKVCETQDGGLSWFSHTEGLPQENCFDLVFRHAFDAAEGLMAFGTTNGNLYISENKGKKWKLIHSHLPPIHVVRVSDEKN